MSKNPSAQQTEKEPTPSFGFGLGRRNNHDIRQFHTPALSGKGPDDIHRPDFHQSTLVRISRERKFVNTQLETTRRNAASPKAIQRYANGFGPMVNAKKPVSSSAYTVVNDPQQRKFAAQSLSDIKSPKK
ncbi:hypothetical protein PGT21_006546 [Puccinia graminis f. sp. tritici]|uniref:Uncharacterized protein n=1 Tax=Puccinia graminis f. sp. tritici TaxID=56615 RepID=A0A5B0M541_PUCGR|nr:hypothetical protein PGT21_006546 [Puccinia graminis f. sp. tritici]KAA1123118.1 hypothetical protein PGTUg99_010705 [Puccinia graminis f. sp. tritici]